MRSKFADPDSFADQFSMLFSDKEVKLLMLWAVIAPAAGIGYLIWIKYPKLRLLALLGFAFGLVQFSGNIGGVFALLNRFGLVLSI